MAKLDLSGPDAQIGAMLSGEDVEGLREAINWLRKYRGIRMNEIAYQCDIPEHTVRNFAYGKSKRPNSTILGKLFKYFVGIRELLPEEFVTTEREPISGPPNEFLGRIARFDLMKMELPISESDLKRVYDRYSGYYLCFRRSSQTETMSVSWLHILPLSPNVKMTRWGLPMPRFTLFTEFADRFDANATQSYVVVGYAFSRSGRIYLTGQHDGNLEHFILNEPPIRKYRYIQGLYLAVSADDSQPFAARVVCQHLGRNASRHDWTDKIGVFPRDQFDKLFEQASTLMHAIGGNDPLVVGNDRT